MGKEGSQDRKSEGSRSASAANTAAFFQQPGVLLAIEQQVLPELLRRTAQEGSIRIWCPGCAGGAEVYSLAMMLLDLLKPAQAQEKRIRIFGTDLNEQTIDSARKGVYKESEVKGVSPSWLAGYFARVDGGYQVSQAVRELGVFGVHDLLRDPPFSKLDLISCRCLSASPSLPRKVWERFHYALKPGGMLLGPDVASGPPEDLFSRVDEKLKFFEKKRDAATAERRPMRSKQPPRRSTATASPAAEDQPASLEQSNTNEELQAAKEELQGANQELMMLNEQLESRNSELARHQEAIQRDRTFIAAILDAAQDLLVVVLDPQGRIQHFNQTCQRLTGYSFEEVRGRRGEDFLVPADDAQAVTNAFTGSAAGGRIQLENHWIAKDGSRLLISWSGSAVMRDGAPEFVIATGVDVTAREEARRRAKESEITVRALLETAAEAILACDKDGRILLANPTAEKMFGYPRGALLDQKLGALIPQRFRTIHARHRKAWFAEPHNRPMGIGLELAGVRRDGSEFPVEVSLSFIDSAEGILGVAFVSDITERRQSERTLLQYKDQLQHLTGALIAAQEAGNREVARELHDVFSQELAVIGMEISSLKDAAGTDAELADRLTGLGKRIGTLAADLHRTSRELHPTILEELGLQAGVQQEFESFQRMTGIPTGYTAVKVPELAPSDVSLTLYRVLQESLRNVHKHSDSPKVTVRIEGSPDGVELRVWDEGDGFDLDEALKKGGLGLISMEERVRLVNGKLTIQSAPGRGTLVTAFVPLPKGVK